MSNELLSHRQQEIVDFLRSHGRNHLYPPTVREIGKAVGLRSSATVQNHLNTLEKKGYIHRDPSKSRTLELLHKPSVPKQDGMPENRTIAVPLVGRVAAGMPVLAEQNIETYLNIGTDLVGTGTLFALTVHGDSMVNAGIFDRDIVIVHSQSDAQQGSIAVVRLENPQTGEHEVTVKRLYKEKNHIRLQPENDFLEPMYVRDVHIEGIVVAVIRLMHA